MPEYLRNKIQKIKEDCEIWVFEKSHEMTYNTVRKRIEKTIGQDRIITWGSLPYVNLKEKLTEISPDIVHFEEPCEQFISKDLLDWIFRENRPYKIFETFHDSSIRPEEKIYLPDKFIVVSPWQIYLIENLGVPVEVIEHELETKPPRNRESAIKRLGLDPNKKHVVQIGIFTPRKNQAETINLARILPDVEFHLVGTLAENFKSYWDPLVSSITPNCRIWGERDDVENFYEACDVCIVPSLALFNDKETSPLVIKEAINWNIPLLMRNLSVYVDMFQESEKIKFMSNNIEETADILVNMLGSSDIKKKEPDLFKFEFSPDENKITLYYIGNKVIKDYIGTVKDIDSNTCIHSFPVNLDPGWALWIVPIPKPYFDFSENKNFTGFSIEIYENRQDVNPICVQNIELEKRIRKKRILSHPSLNFEPIFVNYTQFFVDGIYNNFFAGHRIRSVIDVGANVGLFTEWILDRFGSDTLVLGVEPNSAAAKAFNAMHEGKSNVKFSDVAVSDTSGDEIEMMVNPQNTLISSIEGAGDGYTERQIVKTKKLVDLMKDYELEEVDLLKVDVEGAEYQIFSCISSEEIRKRFKHLLIEFHNNQGRAPELIEKIRSAGYLVDLRDEDTRYSTNENNDGGNIFATRID